jgi:hypothetical protein
MSLSQEIEARRGSESEVAARLKGTIAVVTLSALAHTQRAAQAPHSSRPDVSFCFKLQRQLILPGKLVPEIWNLLGQGTYGDGLNSSECA